MLHGTDILLDMIAGRDRGAGPVLPGKTASSEFPSLDGVLLASMRKRAKARPQHPQPVSLPELLRASLHKQAQAFTALGEASKQQHPYEKSVADMHAQRQRAAQAAEARRNAPVRGMTGDTEYDNLPDVKRRRLYENMERQKQEYLKSRQDLIQRKDQATIQKETGPTKSWGDNKWVRRAAGAALAPINATVAAAGSIGLGVSNWMNGNSFMDGQRGYWKDTIKEYDDRTHDQVNNLQMWANSVGHGAANVGRAINYGAHKVLGADDATLYSLNNEWDNANDAHTAKLDALQGKFYDISLQDPNSSVAKFNRFAVEQSGKLLGETAAMGGVGGLAGKAGRAIQLGSRALSGAVRGAPAASAGARAAGWGARAVQGTRNMAAKGIDYAGDALASPLNMASHAILHPVASVRSMGGSMANFARHPLQQGVKALTSEKLWKPYMGVSAWNDIAHGNIGGAAGQVGDIAAMGALGGWYLPVMVGRDIYSGMQGNGGEDPYPYGEY